MSRCPKCRRPVADNDVCECCHDTRIRMCAVCGEDIHAAECDWAAVRWADMRNEGYFRRLLDEGYGWVCLHCYEAWHEKQNWAKREGINPERGL